MRNMADRPWPSLSRWAKSPKASLVRITRRVTTENSALVTSYKLKSECTTTQERVSKQLLFQDVQLVIKI